MKSFFRWGAALGLLGSSILGPALIGNLPAWALTEEQIVQRLRTVPVFMIAKGDGGVLSQCIDPGNGQQVNCNQEKKVLVTPAFISQRDAQTVLAQLKNSNPQQGQNLQVVPRSLGFVYQQLEEAKKNQQEPLVVDFLPIKQQVDSAMALLRQSGQQVQQFNGVPLFVAKFKSENKYLTIPQGEDRVIPFFFEREQVNELLDSFKRAQPTQANNIEIQVLNLESIIQTLRTSNDPVLTKIVLVPSRESLEFLRSLPASAPNNQQQRPNQPQPQQRPAQPQQRPQGGQR